MGDLDLVGLRRIAEAATGDQRIERHIDHVRAFDPPTVLALIDRIQELEAERDSAGSCWDEGPEQIGVDDCDRVWLKCRLRAGHAGAHRDGRAEWMRRDSYNQVVAERDRAEARLARVTDLVMDTDGGWLSGDAFDGLAGAIQEAIRAVAADGQVS